MLHVWMMSSTLKILLTWVKFSQTEDKEMKKKVSTLKTNLANINMNKLETTYNIDLMFNKMFMVFDKGGAKGLLLIDIGAVTNGCRIVLDTKEEDLLLSTENAVSHRD